MTLSDWYFLDPIEQKKHQIKAQNISKVIKRDISQGCCSSAFISNANSTTCHNVPTTNPKQVNPHWESWQGISSSLALMTKN